MTTTQTVCFTKFKEDWTLHGNDEDYFLYTHWHGCSESIFETWLKSNKVIIANHPESLKLSLNEITLPEGKWHILTEWFERDSLATFITNQYPKGFFEAVRDNGEVAAFLPDTYSKDKFRISYYRKNGPTHHVTYNTRIDALKVLARNQFKAKEGALDELLGTFEWNRGLFICKWISEGISAAEGVIRDGHLPEVQSLFALEPAMV